MRIVPGLVTSLDPFLVQLAGDDEGQPCDRVGIVDETRRGAVLVGDGGRTWLGPYDAQDVAAELAERASEAAEVAIETQRSVNIVHEAAMAAAVDVEDIRVNVIPSLTDQVVVADGRFTGSVISPTLADGAGKPLEAIWTQYDGERLVQSWLWTGAEWVEREPALVHIDQGTYGDLDGVRIRAKSIVAGTLAAGALDFETATGLQLTAGQISGSEIVGGEVRGAVFVVGEAGAGAALSGSPDSMWPTLVMYADSHITGSAEMTFGVDGLRLKRWTPWVNNGPGIDPTPPQLIEDIKPRPMAAGTATITHPGGAVNASVTVTLPSGRFSSAPVITITPTGLSGREQSFIYKTASKSAGSFVIWAYGRNASSGAGTLTVDWVAVAP